MNYKQNVKNYNQLFKMFQVNLVHTMHGLQSG